MAPQKRKADAYDKSDPFVADSDGESAHKPVTKKSRGANTKPEASGFEMRTDDDGNHYWEISKTRRITVSEFKGKKMISIREYYEKDGKSLPGKKGITMTVEQYSALLAVVPQIEAELPDEAIPRPKYLDGPVGASATTGDLHTEPRDDKKANIEATSDEDEDE